MNSVPLVKVWRGSNLEAVHHGSVAVVNAQGELIHQIGDPEAVFMTRSSIKPFQLLPLLLTGAADHYGFDNEQLAVMCGSHNGSDYHHKIVSSILKAAGNVSELLQCGCHWPIGMNQSNNYPLHGEDKDPIRHNCSGKHSGFLALAKYLGDDLSEYLKPTGKTQKDIKAAVSRYCEYDLPNEFYGTDGCSAPNFPLPLSKLALAFKKLACGEGSTDNERDAIKRIGQAMLEHPLLVSGENRFDYDLARSFEGNLLCKVGAEGIEGIGLAKQQIGIAVKITDGSWRSLWPVCLEVLRQLGIIANPEEFPYLEKHFRPEIKNVRGIVTGHIEVNFELKKI